jgi:voltage-gated potassium channel
MRTSVWRVLRAQLRDAQVLLQESWISLCLFLFIILAGAIILTLGYTLPGTDQHPHFSEALHAAFSLVFFEIVLPYPREGAIQIIYFVIPIIGLAVVADGVIRFGRALVSKQERGQKWQVAMASTYHNHILVCGVGKVGYRVILELLKLKRDVVAIEQNADNPFVEKIQEMKIPVIIADARRTEALIRAGVRKADAILPCTDDELTNLDIALDAREINPGINIVIRMFDPDRARRVEKGFGGFTVFSTSALAAPVFASAAIRANVRHSFYVGENLLHISEVIIQPDSRILGWSVGQLETELDLSVICHERDGCTDLHPSDELDLLEEDAILVLASLDTLRRLSEMNHG